MQLTLKCQGLCKDGRCQGAGILTKPNTPEVMLPFKIAHSITNNHSHFTNSGCLGKKNRSMQQFRILVYLGPAGTKFLN